MLRKTLVLLFLSGAIATASYESCGADVACAEKELVKLIDRFDAQETVPVVGDIVTVQRVGDEGAARQDEGIVERLMRYLSCHELKIRFPTNSGVARSFLEVSRKSKLKKIILPILLLLKLKALVVVPAILSAIALVAFKGLGAGLVALTLSAATALKSLLDVHSSKRVSFEVVPPHWSRAGYATAAAASPYFQDWPLYHTITQ